jgi:hypothetical protein
MASPMPDLPDVPEEELAEALSLLDEYELRQGPDHPYDPAKDPDAVPPWERES